MKTFVVCAFVIGVLALGSYSFFKKKEKEKFVKQASDNAQILYSLAEEISITDEVIKRNKAAYKGRDTHLVKSEVLLEKLKKCLVKTQTLKSFAKVIKTPEKLSSSECRRIKDELSPLAYYRLNTDRGLAGVVTDSAKVVLSIYELEAKIVSQDVNDLKRFTAEQEIQLASLRGKLSELTKELNSMNEFSETERFIAEIKEKEVEYNKCAEENRNLKVEITEEIEAVFELSEKCN